MKKLIIVLLILSNSFLAQAGELNGANLQGSWLILTINGQYHLPEDAPGEKSYTRTTGKCRFNTV